MDFGRKPALSLLLAAGCRETDNSEKQEVGTIKIASFNIRIFSSNSRDDEELGYIAGVLEKYDVIAIQELRDEEALERTVAMLKNRGKEYGYEISEKVGRRVKERYGFLYKKGIVRKVTEGRLYEEENDEFIREPFYATFKAENFDFTLVTIHVLYGSSKAERRPQDDREEVWRSEEMAQDDEVTLSRSLASENPGTNDLFSNEC